MVNPSATIRAFDVNTATPEEIRALYTLHYGPRGLRTEEWPDDPPRPFERWLTGLQTIPSFLTLRIWVAWQGEEAVGRSSLEIYDMPKNRHVANVHVGVIADHRRQGIGRQLLAPLAEAAEAAEKTLLLSGTDEAIPAGRALAERMGARQGMVERTNQLSLGNLDPVLMTAWRDQGPRAEYELGWWEGAYPEEEIDAVCDLMAVMNTAPRDDLEIEDQVWTREILREGEESMRQRHAQRCTLYARHRASGELAGYTEVYHDPSTPHVLHQWDTGVFPKYRGHGLGKWLKAAMVERVPRDWPDVRFIRTENANSNAPMLKINNAMGFRPYKDWIIWQVEVARVKAYLSRQHPRP